jgi:ribonucleoside-diphosphate reductase alpha chain
MEVIKRDGRVQSIFFDKITDRIKNLCNDENLTSLDNNFIDPIAISKEVITNMKNKMKTTEIDILSAEVCASFITKHPDYSKLAARILISNLQKNTQKKFSRTIEDLYNYFNVKVNDRCPLVSKELYEFVIKHKNLIDEKIDDNRDLNMYNYFGFKTLEKNYLIKIDGRTVERPQYLYMRVSLAIHLDKEINDKQVIEDAFETYDLMSQGYFIHATPTLFSYGTSKNTGSSCFLLDCGDSIEGIMKCVSDSALLMKRSGGVGINFNKVRSNGSYIKSSNGQSNGIVPWLRILNQVSKGVNQSGKRPGSIAIYLQPWNFDIFDFLKLKRNTGHEDDLARSLFYALFIPDEFMRRVEKNEMWSLMCPHECNLLNDKFGKEFDDIYKQYELEKKYRVQVRAQDLWKEIIKTQIETGIPYLLNFNACNEKNNQKALGTLKSSNLCAEILIYTSETEVGTCNLANVALGRYVDNNVFNFQKLFEVSKVITKNLNKIIDNSYYIIPESKTSNLTHRPIAIGVQGLYDVFMKLRLEFTSLEAKKLNSEIFEAIYFGALTASNELAKIHGPYSSFKGSPFSQGKFQFDLVKEFDGVEVNLSGRWDWEALKQNVIQFGTRNSLVTACMPTASTSNILGQTECIEAPSSNIYFRRGVFGEYCILNEYMVKDLIALNLWNDKMKDKIIMNNGSVQNIPEIPDNLKELYKTMYELKKKDLIDMAADRGAFIDQTQSFNIYVDKPDIDTIHTIHLYSWRKRLKTMCYYLRTSAAVNPIKITLDAKQIIDKEDETCKPGCESCSS